MTSGRLLRGRCFLCLKRAESRRNLDHVASVALIVLEFFPTFASNTTLSLIYNAESQVILVRIQ